jgi:hypothetical protein
VDNDDDQMLSCKELFQAAAAELGFTYEEGLHFAGAKSDAEFDVFSEEQYERLVNRLKPFEDVMSLVEPRFEILQAFMRSSHPSFNDGKSIKDLLLECTEESYLRAVETLEFRLGWGANYRAEGEAYGPVTIPNQMRTYEAYKDRRKPRPNDTYIGLQVVRHA